MKPFFEKIKTNFKPWMKNFFFSFIWLGILMLGLDILSKQLIVANQATIRAAGPEGVVLIPGFLAVNYIINTNVVFGLSFISDKMVTRILYIVIASLLSGGLIAYYCIKRKKLGKYVKACLMLILAGAIGNLIDRIFFTPEFLGYDQAGKVLNNGVVDWINFYGIWKFNFNWADSCIVVGCIMLIVFLIVTEIIEYVKKSKAQPKVKQERQLSKDELERLEREKQENEKEIENNKNE